MKNKFKLNLFRIMLVYYHKWVSFGEFLLYIIKKIKYSSEIMLHKKINIPKELSHDIMEELGNLDDCLHFVDLNKGNIKN